MPFDKSQALDAAKQHLLQGNKEAAIGIYLKIIDANRSDLETIDMLGDLYANEGRVRDAIGEFSKAADGYLADSLTRKAITVLRKITALDPGNIESSLKLADVYAQAGLLGDARQHYLQIAETYSRKGQTMDALAVYCKIVALDPSNTSMRIKLGELYLREGLNEQAYETFLTAGNQLAAQGEHRRALNAYKEALAIRPKGVEALAGVRRVTAGDNGALIDKPLATVSLSGSSSNPTSLSELDSRRVSETLEINSGEADSTFVVQEISKAELLVAYGQADEAISMLKNVASRLPESVDVRVKLKDIYLRNGMMAEASAECRELEMIYRAQGDDSRARDYAMRASRLAQTNERSSGDLDSPVAGPVTTLPPPVETPSAGFTSNHSANLVSLPGVNRELISSTPALSTIAGPVTAPAPTVEDRPAVIAPNNNGNPVSRTTTTRAVIPMVATPPPSTTAERPLSPPLQLVRKEEQPQQALVKADSKSSLPAVGVSLSPRADLVTGALQLTRASSSPIVKKRSRVAIAGVAAGILAMIGAGAVIGGVVYNNHLNNEYQALTLVSPEQLPAALVVPTAQDPNDAQNEQNADSISVDVIPDVTPATKPETPPHEPALDRRSTVVEQPASSPAPSSAPGDQRKLVTREASPSVSLPRTTVNADSRPIADTRTPAGVPVIAPSAPPAPAAPLPKPVTQTTTGVVLGAAVKRVEPGYPDVARRSNQIGSVKVEVSIDEQGNVTAAHALTGPLVLRNAATGAALGWKFRPSTMAGVPVKTTTTIVFNFKL